MSCVIIYFYFSFNFLDKVVKLVGGGSVIDRSYPDWFFYQKFSYPTIFIESAPSLIQFTSRNVRVPVDLIVPLQIIFDYGYSLSLLS